MTPKNLYQTVTCLSYLKHTLKTCVTGTQIKTTTIRTKIKKIRERFFSIERETMISDKLTIVTGILEVLLFGGSVYGFSFLQTIMEKEFVYWKYFWKGSKFELICHRA